MNARLVAIALALLTALPAMAGTLSPAADRALQQFRQTRSNAVLVPQAHLVAVRQIEAQDHPAENDSYDDFEKQVLALARTLGAEFPTAPAGH